MGRERLGVSTPMVLSLASLAAGAGFLADQLDFTAIRPTRVRVYTKITTGAVALTNAGELIKFYLVRDDRDPVAPHRDDNLGIVAAPVSTEPEEADLVGTLVLATTTAGKSYYRSFVIELPGDKMSLVAWNAASQGLSATEADHYIRYRVSTIEE